MIAIAFVLIQPRPMDPAILEALKWLARHQEPDGSWKASTFPARCSGRPCLAGTQVDQETTGVTALATLAFLSAGYELQCQDAYDGVEFGKVLRAGVKHLLGVRQKDGLLATRSDDKPVLCHAMAVLALAHALRSGENEELRAAVQQGVALLVAGRTPGCADCGGKGRSSKLCAHCAGSGRCGACKGQGHQHETGCRICAGKATRADSGYYCIECTETASGKCAACGGAGKGCNACKAKPGACASCSGTGAGREEDPGGCRACLREKRGSGKCLRCDRTGYPTCSGCAGTKKYGKQIRRGWKYQFTDPEGDASVTSWCLTALLAARSAGATFEPAVLDGAFAWIDGLTSPNGAVGYNRRGAGRVFIPNQNERYDDHPALAAATISCRLKAGLAPTPLVQAGIDLVYKDVPNARGMARDYYYWFFAATMVAHHKSPKETWKKSLLQAVTASRDSSKDPCASGSWEPIDRCSCSGGRVYATAINAVTLAHLKLPAAFKFESK